MRPSLGGAAAKKWEAAVKILTSLALIALTLCLAAGSQVTFAGDAEARSYKRYGGHYNNKWRRHRVARGVAIGVGTAVVVGGVNYNYSCKNLAYRCRQGEYWACNKFDDRC